MSNAADLHNRPFNRLKDCRYGKMLYNENDTYVGRSFAEYGEYSEGEVELFRKILRPGNNVLDVGANIGAHTIFFAQQIAPGGAVVAFEPQRMVYQTLCANIALNSLMNVFAENKAVGASPGAVVIRDFDPRKPNNFGGVSVDLHANLPGLRVPVITIDSLPLMSLRLIKVDVEGMEADVLRGARQTIQRLKPILYVENDRADKSGELVPLFWELGYDTWWHTPQLFNPNNFAGNSKDVFDRVASFNVLCLPHGSSDTALAEGLTRVAQEA